MVSKSYKEKISKWVYLIKYPFKLWVYELIDQWVIYSVRSKPQKKLLIYRLDLIGDYLMSRPFFDSLRKKEKWKDYSFGFAGNQQLQELAERWDRNVFNQYLWIDRTRFINSLVYRYQILKKIREAGFEILLYPSHTRQYWLESVVKVSGATKKYTGEAIGTYMSPFEKSLTDPFYTEHVNTGGGILFEFYRNRNFFSYFTEQAKSVHSLVKEARPAIESSKKILIALAPGASTRNRQWPIPSFAGLIEELNRSGKFEFTVIGGPSEKKLGEALQEILPDIPIKNQAGILSIPQSIDFISQIHLLISNESSPVHMAATTGTPCICISQGNHFGRWNPYPVEVASWITTVYPPFFGNIQNRYPELAKQYHDGSLTDVSGI